MYAPKHTFAWTNDNYSAIWSNLQFHTEQISSKTIITMYVLTVCDFHPHKRTNKTQYIFMNGTHTNSTYLLHIRILHVHSNNKNYYVYNYKYWFLWNCLYFTLKRREKTNSDDVSCFIQIFYFSQTAGWFHTVTWNTYLCCPGAVEHSTISRTETTTKCGILSTKLAFLLQQIVQHPVLKSPWKRKIQFRQRLSQIIIDFDSSGN